MNTNVSKINIYSTTDLVMSAVANFNGAEPETSITTTANHIEWAESTNAGLISLASLGLIGGMYKILRIALVMTGQSTYSVDIIDGGTTIPVASGTTAATYTGLDLGYLSGTQQLKITTTGAGTTFVKAIVTLANADWGSVSYAQYTASNALTTADNAYALASTAAPNDQTGVIHVSIMSPSHRGSKGGTTEPTPVDMGPVLADAYTLNNDQGYEVFKLPTSFIGDLSIHAHWTKSTDAIENGKTCRWQITYMILPGNNTDFMATPTVVNIDGTYTDSGTTSRICYRSADISLTGGAAGYYLYIQVMAVTPPGTAMASKPALVSLDAVYTGYLNK